MSRLYTELNDGRVVPGTRPIDGTWNRAWRCNAPAWCGAEPDAACPCRGAVARAGDADLDSLGDALEYLTRRFSGVDLQSRRTSQPSSWPRRWRARLVTNKNERDAFRLTAWEDTADEAVVSLLVAVRAAEAKP